MKLGELFREAREQQQITMQEVEQKTKIRVAYLEAIESDNYDVLPGRIYVLGFLKSYAKFLGLNSEEILGIYNEKYPKQDEEYSNQPTQQRDISPNKHISKNKYYVIAILALASIIALIYYQPNWGLNQPAPIVDNGADEIDLSPDEPAEEIEPQEEFEPPQEPIQEPAVPIDVQLEIVDRPCWLQVTVDGSIIFAGTLDPGIVEQYQGTEEIILHFGNAGAAKVVYNGQDLGFMGEQGQVVTRSFFPAEN